MHLAPKTKRNNGVEAMWCWYCGGCDGCDGCDGCKGQPQTKG